MSTPKKSQKQLLDYRPQEQLRFLSMTEDIEDIFNKLHKHNCKQDIQPWKNEHENPSQSPQRRPYVQRPTPMSLKLEKPQQIKYFKGSNKILQQNNSLNSTFRVKTKRNSTCSAINQLKAQIQNKPQVRISSQRRQTLYKIPQPTFIKIKQVSNQQNNLLCHQPVNSIVYPIVYQHRKKRLFRKLQKFQNFVSVSLRK